MKSEDNVKLNELACCFRRLKRFPTPAGKPTQVTASFQEVCEFRRRRLLTVACSSPAEHANTALCIIPKGNYKVGMLRSQLQFVIKSHKGRNKGKGKAVAVQDMEAY
jgi:hypothetical protein